MKWPNPLTINNVKTFRKKPGRQSQNNTVRVRVKASRASWADALAMLHERLPVVAEGAVSALEGEDALHGCLGELQWAANSFDRHGFISRPQWRALQSGVRPPPANDVEPCEWAHGGQHCATSASEHHFRESVVLAQSCPSHQAHLRSHSGSGCSHVFCGCPTQPEFRINPDLFRVLILERLCGAVLDCKGRHRAACPHPGRLRTRALAPERTLARVCREAGASVRCNAKLVDMNIAVAANDERAIEGCFGSPIPSRSPTGNRHHFALLLNCWWLAQKSLCGERKEVHRASSG